MATEVYIADLEKHWLDAETKADELKQEAKRTQSQDLQARHAAAEQAASDAFDRLWVARDGITEHRAL
jgi:hypothetical protein